MRPLPLASLAAIPLTAVVLSAQTVAGTTRPNVNVIRLSDSTSLPPAAAKKDDASDHTVFWRGGGGYVGNIAGADAAVQSGGSSNASAVHTQSYGSGVSGAGYIGGGYIGGGYASGGGRRGRRGAVTSMNFGGLNPATNNSGVAPGQDINPATNNSGIAPGQTAGKPYHPPTAYGVSRLPLPAPKTKP